MTTEILVSSDKDDEFVYQQLMAFNHRHLGMVPDEYMIPLSFHIRTEDNIIAGITAILFAKSSIYVDILWVNEQHRKHDYGTKLLRHVESKGKELGAAMAHLSTMDFQAKGFYLKQGYELFATLEDSPAVGRRRFFLQKKL
jgi:GNAT superfamily N-acetyltransferase